MSKEQFLSQYGSSEHVDSIMNGTDAKLHKFAMENPFASKDAISKGLASKSPSVSRTAAKRNDLSIEHIHAGLNSTDSITRAGILNHPLDKSHIDRVMYGDFSHTEKEKVIRYGGDAVTKDHLDKAIEDSSALVRTAAMEHPKITKDQQRVYYKRVYGDNYKEEWVNK